MSSKRKTHPINDIRATAYHEAGHAVIGRVLTMQCGDVSIEADGTSAGYSITNDAYEIADIWDFEAQGSPSCISLYRTHHDLHGWR